MTQTTDPRPDNWPVPWGPQATQGPVGEEQTGQQPEPAQPEPGQPDPAQPAPGRPTSEPATEQFPSTGFGDPHASHPQTAPQPVGYPHPDQSYPEQSYPDQGYPDQGYPDQGYSQPQGYPYAPYSQPQGAFPPPPSSGDAPTRGGRQPRRPGWLGVAGVGAGAAVLSSLLTAGLVNQDTATVSPTTSSSQSSTAQQAPGPVTGSSASAPDWAAVASAVEPTVVAVKVSGQSGSGEGSGVILDTKGNVLTNNHVVAEAANNGEIEVVLSDGRGYPATIVGTDPQTDLAVIRINNPPSGLKPTTLGDSSAVKVGNPVMAVGNPLGLSDTVTTGIVSAVDRPVTTGSAADQTSGSSTGTVFTNAIQTDAAINPGNSGGALVDVQGRLIGINSSIASLGSASPLGSQQSGNIGLGFAIPVNEAKDVADQLLANGKVAHAYLGVTLRDGTVALDGAQRQSAEVGDVTNGSPADKAGLRSGDQVIAIDGDRVNGADSLIAQVRERRPGVTVTLSVVRDKATQDVKLTMGTRPND